MVKKIFFSLTVLFFVVESYGQIDGQIINIIITVNDRLELGSITNTRIIIYSNSGENEVEVDYSPGSLCLSDSILDKILSDSIRSLYLAFDHKQSIKGKDVVFNYKLEISENWFKNRYTILRLYQSRKKRLNANKYIYMVDIPGQSILIDSDN